MSGVFYTVNWVKPFLYIDLVHTYLLGHAWVHQLVQVVFVYQEHITDNLFLKQWLRVKFLVEPTAHNLVNELLNIQSKMVCLVKWSSFRLQTERLWVRIPMPSLKFQ